MRGVPFVQVPTAAGPGESSSVGRQDGHQPSAGQEHDRRVLPAPARGRRPGRWPPAPARDPAGLAEVIKYGPIADLPFFGWIRRTPTPSVARSRRHWRMPSSAPARSRPRWSGRTSAKQPARPLNFGHTFGHAIPRPAWAMANGCTAKRSGCGMVMAATRLGWCSMLATWRACATRAEGSVARRPVRALPALGRERWPGADAVDKKTEGGAIRWC